MSTETTEVKLKPISIPYMPYGMTKVATKLSQEIQATSNMVLNQSHQLILDETNQLIQNGDYSGAGEIFSLLNEEPRINFSDMIQLLAGIIADLGSKLPDAAMVMLDAVKLSQTNAQTVLFNAVAQLESRLLKDAAKRLLAVGQA